MSSRRKKKTFHGKDDSQDSIVSALVESGCTVQDMSRIGGGVPDLLVGYQGRNFLIECKPAAGTKKQLNLRDTQEKWHAEWTGQVAVAHTPEDALAIVGIAEFARIKRL